MRPVAVLGAGAFGTSLAICWALAGREVVLWGRDRAAMQRMQADRANSERLPGIAFPDGLRATGDLNAVPPDAVQVLTVPTQAMRAALSDLQGLPDAPLVVAAKGIELTTGALPTDIAAGFRPADRIGVVSGPGFADEIGRGLPTALTVAAPDDLARRLQEELSTATLRLYRSTDLVGVQLGGALKNVIAIACGIAIGAGLGESARAALMTRGFAEMTRLGAALGGRPETFTGLSGLGDLSLTCGSEKSRNFARGLQIGRGETGADGRTVEGVATAEAVLLLARRHHVDLPVAEATASILRGDQDVASALRGLLARPLRAEG